MPDDVPPRPGAPGYDEFIAHGQAGQDSTKAISPGGQSVASVPVKPVFQTTPPAAQPEAPPQAQTAPEPSADDPPENPSVVKGGLY
jgi:hypothetical protein